MGVTHEPNAISTTASLQDFFHQEVCDVVERHRIDGANDTIWYLTRLLCNYSLSKKFFDQHEDNTTLTPLACYYQQAAHATTEYERRQYLQRLGDVAIFIASLFSGALERKPIDVNYYISMGESAYGTLADAGVRTSRDRALVGIFADLANQFPDYVAALSDIPARPAGHLSLIQLVEEWERTGHPGLARRLRAQGVFLPEQSDVSH